MINDVKITCTRQEKNGRRKMAKSIFLTSNIATSDLDNIVS